MADIINETIFDLDRKVIESSFLNWLANRRAHKAFSKAPDILITDENAKFLPKPTKLLLNLQQQLKLRDLFWELEKENSLSGENFILYDFDNETPIITLQNSSKVFERLTYKNRVVEIFITVDFFENSEHTFQIVEHRVNPGLVERYIADIDGNRIEDFNFENFPTELRDKIEKSLLKIMPRDPLTPTFLHSSNFPDNTKDGELITEELKIYTELMQKILDEINVNTTKVVTTDASGIESDEKTVDSNQKSDGDFRRWAARSVIILQSLVDEGSGDSAVVAASPDTNNQFNALSSLVNIMLKKAGASTDVDAKGTVQQTKGEIIMSQGNEYEASKTKLAMRQDLLNDFYEDVILIYENELNQSSLFASVDDVQVILDDSEVLSQSELLANMTIATEKKWIPDIIAKARILGTSIYQAWKTTNLDFGFGHEPTPTVAPTPNAPTQQPVLPNTSGDING